MKSLYFADLHGHNYREFATLDENGVNSRLIDQLKVLKEIKDSAWKHEVQDIRFLGDMLHLKNNHDSLVLKTIIGKMAELAEDFPLLIVPGNHDYRLWTSHPVVLEMLGDLADNVVVVDKPMFLDKVGRYSTGWLRIYAEPYTRKVVELNERLLALKRGDSDILFLGHQDMIGMQYGGFTVDEGLKPEDLLALFKWSFVGHSHTPGRIHNNVISVGAPIQHNFSDVAGDRGWWIFDEEKDKVTFIQNTISPRFWDLMIESHDEDDVKGAFHDAYDFEKDFFRVKVIGDTLPRAVEQIKWKRVSYEVAVKSKTRGDLKFSDSKESIIEKYVNLRGGDLDKKKLIEVGRRYV